MRRHTGLILGLLFPFLLWGQTDLLDSDLSLDALLGGGETKEEEGVVEEAPQENPSVIDDLLDKKSLDIKLSLNLTLGYTPGYDDYRDLSSSYDGSPILEMTNYLVLDYTVSRKLRVYQKWSVETPDFELDGDSLFADYSPADFLSLRAGRFTETWGESRNFPHTNLIDREPDDFSGSTDTLAFRAQIPWKTGSVEALALTREGYWEDEDYPAADEFGYGLRINPPVPNADLTFAVFAHPEMNLRGTVSLKTTLFGSLETYGEGLIAIDNDLYYGNYDSEKTTDDGKVDDPVDFAVNLGLYQDFLGNRLSLGGEYYYNGEESELEMATETWDIYYGHNLAFYLKWKQNDWNIFTYGRYNFYYKSGIVGPGFNWQLSDPAKLQIGGGWAWGDDAYGSDNPDDFDRELFAYVQLVIKGSWEGTF
ncbi:MAG: hypothetical protein PQJ60_09295 [Spirochaetales bacterium]|nr:hypothetical protein [Spirochaetales bacterium]